MKVAENNKHNIGVLQCKEIDHRLKKARKQNYVGRIKYGKIILRGVLSIGIWTRNVYLKYATGFKRTGNQVDESIEHSEKI